MEAFTYRLYEKAVTQHKMRQALPIPPDLNSKEFASNKYEYYKWLREEAPVFKGKLSVIEVYAVSRYDDCLRILKDPRFVRNRTTATGGSRFPIPVPKSVITLMTQRMDSEDDPDHRRLRNLVHQAFTRYSLANLSARIDQLTNDLLDKAEAASKAGRTIDIQQDYALPIPVTVIQEMVGVDDEDMPRFKKGIAAMKEVSGWALARTLLWDLPYLNKFIRELIGRKRLNPQNDILSSLIQAEEDGEKLTADELVSMVFLLIVAGYETTVNLITNGVLTLLQHSDQLERLKNQPELIESAVEEILRFAGPVHGTKPEYALEDVVMHGVTIPKGSAVFVILGSANHDPAAFDNPEVFDITRDPNKHIGFGSGIHACLGAPLARMETKIALTNLLKRNPNLRLAVNPSMLEVQRRPGWHTYKNLPVLLG